MSNISFYITWNQKIFFTWNQNYHYYYLYSGVIHLFIQSWIGPIILVLQLVCSLEVVLSSHCYTSFGWEYRDYVNGYFTESMTAERLSLRTTKYRINSDKNLLTIYTIKKINSLVLSTHTSLEVSFAKWNEPKLPPCWNYTRPKYMGLLLKM